jgi:hypothetical protein
VRIFQLAQELNINSQEIIDALDDMGIAVKSNLAVLEDNVVSELKELFKPKPKSVSRSAKDDAVKKALAEREARDRALREAARREEERKSAARRAALERAAARRSPSEAPMAHAAEIETVFPRTLEHIGPEIDGNDVGVETTTSQPISDEVGSAVGAKADAPTSVAPVTGALPSPPATMSIEPRAPNPNAPISRLGKAVIAPPPSTARERAEMLGRPLSQVSQPQRSTQPSPANRRPSAPAPRQAPAQRPRGPVPGTAAAPPAAHLSSARALATRS